MKSDLQGQLSTAAKIGASAQHAPGDPQSGTARPCSHHLDRRAFQLIDHGAGGDPDDLLDTAALTDWLGLSKQWAEIGRSRGYGPPFIRLGPRRIRYRRKDVLRWLESRVYARTADYKTAELDDAAHDADPEGDGGAS